MEIKAVLFDCDGLMFETEIVSQQMWRDEAAKYGVTLPEDFFLKITGASRADVKEYEDGIPGLSAVLPLIQKKRFNLDFWSSIHTDCLNKKGLIDLFEYLETNKVKIAVCSSSNSDYVKTLIHTVSEPLHYDAMVTGDMVTHSKPDPEVFLKGAEELHVKPEECLVLEDSKQGIIAAYRAGMHSCFIYDTIRPDSEMKRVMEFQEPSLDEVIGLLEHLRSQESSLAD
ncbi:MAG: HAD family phosphatase [Solobacterium sp.]|jgi:beta-phosphoglucomutase-like phosphatase (HAD superfamily)|nr:HAD family phosphatase [Solobacterium sp.]